MSLIRRRYSGAKPHLPRTAQEMRHRGHRNVLVDDGYKVMLRGKRSPKRLRANYWAIVDEYCRLRPEPPIKDWKSLRGHQYRVVQK